MSPACTNRRRTWTAAALALMAAFASFARAEEPLPLASAIQRAIAYDPQVRTAQANLDALVQRPADGVEPPRTRTLRNTRFDAGRPAAVPAPAAGPDAALDNAERELRRAREQAAARAAAAALELQRQDRIVALAQQRATDVRRLVQRSADPLRRVPFSDADRREAEAAQRRADAALVDAQADRLAAVHRLESITGHVAQGVAGFDWPASPTPNPVGEEVAARERMDGLSRQAREARAVAGAALADPARRGVVQAVQARETLYDAELRTLEAGYVLGRARLDEQMRMGTWQRTLAEAPAMAGDTTVVATAPPPQRGAIDPALDAAFRQWAQAWRSKDVGRYLASYADDFEPAGLSRETWRVQRKARLTRPGPLDIAIDDHRWEASAGNTAEVRFVQRYRSKTYADSSEKRLVWRNGPQGWRIVAELARTDVVERPRSRRPA